MKSLRFLDRRAGYSLASIGMLLGVVAPAALPAFATADVLTSRSVTMSSSTASATNVSYTAQFTVATPIVVGGGFVLQFCDSATGPLLDQACDEPAGMDLSSAAVGDVSIDTGSGFNAASSAGTLTSANETSSSSNDNYVKWVSGTGDSLSANDKLKVEFTGVDNPSTTGTFYARIYTYASTPDFTDSTTPGTIADNGSVALSTTSAIGVTAYVLESMTFCVSGQDIDKNCGNGITPGDPGSVTNPSMTIGQTSGNVTALSATAVSTKNAYAQLSTNASGGAVVNLKSDATGCGGLYRNGVSDAGHCNIPPLTTAGAITAGTAKFGVEVGDATDPSDAVAADMSGTLQQAGSYSASDYLFGYMSGDASGVTGPYGDPIFNSNSLPVSNKNVPLTFGATIANNTPAGVYGAKLNLIATGTF